ncbi:MAG: hypothetical protein AAF408_08295 [Pseudomonadota bacterium]
MRFIELVATATICFAMASGASGKSLSRIIAETGLSPEDYNVMRDASDELFTGNGPSPGRSVSWANKTSGTQGTSRIGAVSGNCAEVQHAFRPKGDAEEKKIRTKRCRNAQGSWVLTP